jgi:hypothetical protein
MKYRNDDPKAVIAMELERTGYYGDFYNTDSDLKCHVCGATAPEHFYMNDDEECVGCYECLHKVFDLF